MTQGPVEATMPLLQDLLLRFRRVWSPPGAVVGQAAVPVDVQARVEDELRELTAALEVIEREGEAIVRDAQAQAASILTAARTEAERRIESARAKVPEQRSQSAAARIRHQGKEITARIAEAERQAGAIGSHASVRMKHLVDQVTADAYAGIESTSEVTSARVVGGG
jgi:hypothetical protein